MIGFLVLFLSNGLKKIYNFFVCFYYRYFLCIIKSYYPLNVSVLLIYFVEIRII